MIHTKVLSGKHLCMAHNGLITHVITTTTTTTTTRLTHRSSYHDTTHLINAHIHQHIVLPINQLDIELGSLVEQVAAHVTRDTYPGIELLINVRYGLVHRY